MSGLEKIWLIRHGEIKAAPKTLIGRTDAELADPERTKQIALALCRKIKNADAVFSSDLQRAVQTAAPYCETFGLNLIADKALREINFGDWEKMTWAQIEKQQPEAYRQYMDNWKTVAAPNGESFAMLKNRVEDFLDDLLRRDDIRRAVIVAHRGSLEVIARRLLEISDEEQLGFAIERDGAAMLCKYDSNFGWTYELFSPEN